MCSRFHLSEAISVTSNPLNVLVSDSLGSSFLSHLEALQLFSLSSSLAFLLVPDSIALDSRSVGAVDGVPELVCFFCPLSLEFFVCALAISVLLILPLLIVLEDGFGVEGLVGPKDHAVSSDHRQDLRVPLVDGLVSRHLLVSCAFHDLGVFVGSFIEIMFFINYT